MPLKTNLKLAQWAVTKTSRLIPHSTNVDNNEITTQQYILLAMVRQKLPLWLKRQLRGIPFDAQYSMVDDSNYFLNLLDSNGQEFSISLIDLAQHLFKDYPSKAFYHRSRDPLLDIEHMARKAFELRVGNCAELSATVFNLLLECRSHPSHGGDILINRLSLKPPADHCFVVIGRAADAQLKDINTWGPDAVICDPWYGGSFSVAEQLALPLDQREYMFKYIKRNLDHCIESIEDKVSGGHSVHWQNKEREDLREKLNFASPGSRNSLFQATNSSSRPLASSAAMTHSTRRP